MVKTKEKATWSRSRRPFRHIKGEPYAGDAIPQLPYDNKLAPPLSQTQEPDSGDDSHPARAGLGVRHNVYREQDKQHVPVADNQRVFEEDSRLQPVGQSEHRWANPCPENGAVKQDLQNRVTDPPF